MLIDYIVVMVLPSASAARPRAGLAAVVLGEIAIIGLLHWSGTNLPAVTVSDPVGWLRATPLLDVTAVSARFIGLLTAYWLFATTVAYTVALNSGAQRVAHLLRYVTLPVVRRLAHGVTVASITSVSLVGPLAGASGASAPVTPVVELAQSDGTDAVDTDGVGTDRPADATNEGFQPATSGLRVRRNGFWLLETPLSTDQGTTTADSNSGANSETGNGGSPSERDRTPGSTAGARNSQSTDGSSTVAEAGTYQVVKGDNFWTIAESHLTATNPGRVDAAELRQYWVELVDLNRASIRSGDPDLIFPGEVVKIPAP